VKVAASISLCNQVMAVQTSAIEAGAFVLRDSNMHFADEHPVCSARLVAVEPASHCRAFLYNGDLPVIRLGCATVHSFPTALGHII
jgi:hypothetical protein